MCGIAGIWNLSGAPVGVEAITRFTRTLRHRGPDGEGIHVDDGGALGLGHRRLAILDLSPAGQQPMSYGDGRYWITFNGEIYDFLELRRELEAAGHRFATESDTEVVLAAYAQWGAACQLRFNGMWAFAIWDRVERELFVSRDRFGVKPLHYLFDGRRFAFASEMKAFLGLEGFEWAFDPQVVADALADSNALEGGEACLLRGLRRLRPGHHLTLRRGGAPSVRRWWRTIDHLEPAPKRFEDQFDRLGSLLRDACRIRMRSDVAIGTAVSGGLDSGAVLCTMSEVPRASGDRVASDWQRAFVATYPGTVQDERALADVTIRAAGAAPVYVELRGERMLDRLDEVLFEQEEIHDLVLGPSLVYAAMRRAGVVVSVDGHGGDELLAGYHHHPEIAIQDHLAPPHLRALREIGPMLTNVYPAGAAPPGRDLPSAVYRAARELGARWPPMAPLRSLVRACRRAVPDAPVEASPWLVRPNVADPMAGEIAREASPLPDALNRRLYVEFHATLLPTILRNFDRASMAHGVEVRAPFMDWRLVCLGFSLPSTSKIGRGFTKLVLREAMRGHLPEEVRTRTVKIGFSNPLAEWLGGPLAPLVRDTIASREFLESPIWNGPLLRAGIERAYDDRRVGPIRDGWRFVQAALLMRRFATASTQARAAVS